MTAALEAVSEARERRDTAEHEFRTALREARTAGHSWTELAAAASLSKTGVIYLVKDHNQTRRKGRA